MVSYYNIIKFFIIYNIETKYDDVKDSFMKLKFQLSEKISKFEHLLLQKDTFNENPSGKELVEKYKIDKKLVEINKELQSDIVYLERELKAQKKKKNKFSDLDKKEKTLNLLKEKIKILEKKYKEEAKDKTEIKNNDNNIQSLDDFLKENKDKNNSKERELYKEEKYKIEEYERKKNEQDELLNEIHVGLIDLKQDAINAGRQIKEMNKKIEEGKRRIDENNNKIKTQIDRIKDLTK